MLACAIFDILQLVTEKDGWDVIVSRRKKGNKLGEVLPDKDKIVIYAHQHLGGDMGSMAVTLLHEQIHAALGVNQNDSPDAEHPEEAWVRVMEEMILDGIDDKRRAQLEYLLRE